jgi:outer membrane protein TolC
MKRMLIMTAGLLLSLTAYAQLTLEDCISKAKAHYPEIAQYDLVDASEQYNLEAASRGWIPQITLSGQATWQSAVTSFPDQLKRMLEAQGMDFPGIAKDQYKVAVDVSQTIWDGGVSAAQKKMAAAEASEQRLSSDVSIYALQDRISSLFFGILLLDQNYEALLARKALLEANMSRLEALRREGAALESDLDLLRVEQLSLGQQLEQNRSSRDNYAAMLSIFMGEEVGNRYLIKPQQVIVPAGINNRPELQLLDAKIAGVEAKKALLDASVTPKINFFAQGYYGNPGLNMFQAMTSRDWTWNAYLGVRIQWNVNALFNRKSDLRQLETTRGMLTVQRETFSFNSSLQTTQQAGEIQRILLALQSDEEIVRLRGRIRQTAESQREKGVIDTATLLQRITEESLAVTARNAHEIELLKAMYDLKFQVNQ